jgi:hypothetical protein
MDTAFEQPEPRPDIVSALRASAKKGATVRELAAVIQTRLGYGDDIILPVVWYFMKAFSLRLPDALPIRDWLIGARNDEEVDSLILQRIENTRPKWQVSGDGSKGAGATETAGDHSLSAVEQEG